jgi:hypothetical protein
VEGDWAKRLLDKMKKPSKAIIGFIVGGFALKLKESFFN